MKRASAITLIILFVLSAWAEAAVFVIRPDGTGDFPTIQAALDVAVDGDIIELADGTFAGPGNRELDYAGKELIVRAQGMAMLDAGGGHAVSFGPADGPSAVIDGVVIFGGSGGAIHFDGSSATAIRCSILSSDRGIVCRDGAQALIAECRFEGNGAAFGGALHCSDSSPTIFGCLFVGNQAADLGGACSFYDSTPTIQHCTFYDNAAVVAGDAIEFGNSSGIVEHCIFAMNIGTLGQLTVCWGSSSPTFSCCDFYENSGTHCGVSGGDHLAVDPLFCDADAGNFTLFDDSPCLPENSPCGELVGAFGAGCTVVSVPGPGTIGASLTVGMPRPQPASGAITVDVQLEVAAPITLTLIDVSGRVVSRRAAQSYPKGHHVVRWELGGTDGLTSGVYVVHVQSPTARASTRAVIIR